MIEASGPIGVFDSGLGGLTVVHDILHHLPNERIVYVGDEAHVPYGDAPARRFADSLGIGGWLANTAGCRAIVVACNTATAAGVDALRSHVGVPIVGMEPGVKPAAAVTRTGRVAVLATISTLSADRFSALCERYAHDLEVITQPCPGLVECVERGDLAGAETRALVERYVRPLIERGVDTLVLGCTHYPLLRLLIAEIAGPEVTIIDTGNAVARQLVRVVGAAVSAVDGRVEDSAVGPSCIHAFTTGTDAAAFGRLSQTFLGDVAAICPARLRWTQGELENADTAS